MKIADLMRDTFSPYEASVLAGPPSIIIFLCALALAESGSRLPALLLFILSLAWALFFGIVGQCPGCGKSPWVYYPFSEQGWLRKWRRARFWPERECSACRAPLDVI